LGAALVLVVCGCVLLSPFVAQLDPLSQNLRSTLRKPSSEHWLGTDQLGRDIVSRVVYGGRLTLLIGVLTTLMGTAVGLALGLTGGYFGRIVEALVMRAVDVLMALPDLLLSLTLVAAMGYGTKSVVVAVGIASVPAIARVTHGVTKRCREQGYVSAAYALGASDLGIIFRHILPNIAPAVLSIASIRWCRNILLVSALSIVGIGVQPPTAEWGLMIAEGRLYLAAQPLIVLVPAALIVLVGVGLNLFGIGLREASMRMHQRKT